MVAQQEDDAAEHHLEHHHKTQTRRHRVSSALAGYEAVNWGKKVLHDGSTLHDRDAFIYGGALTLDVECYVADRIALLANLRERCLWGGDTRKFHTQFGIGIKFIIG